MDTKQETRPQLKCIQIVPSEIARLRKDTLCPGRKTTKRGLQMFCKTQPKPIESSKTPNKKKSSALAGQIVFRDDAIASNEWGVHVAGLANLINKLVQHSMRNIGRMHNGHCECVVEQTNLACNAMQSPAKLCQHQQNAARIPNCSQWRG